jgi:hypothetical protein
MRLAAFVVVAIVAWLVFGGTSYEAWHALPGSRYRLVISLAQMHPYLAEYERELRVEGNGRATTLHLFPDTGGYALVNVYSVSPSSFVLRTMGNDEYVIDSQSGQVQQRRHLSECDGPGPRNAAFLGAFDFDTARRWRFISADERAERLVWACEKHT